MIAITSICPVHANEGVQLKAVLSWIANGIKVYSLNSEEEISRLKKEYKGVEFIPVDFTGENLYGKPYVLLNSVLGFANSQEDEDIIIINSDIELSSCRGVLEYEFKERCNNSVGVIQRLDYDEKIEEGQTYIYGFDVFLIKKKFLSMLPPSVYALGQTWWDYWLPYTIVKKGGNIHRVAGVQALHKRHKQRWDDAHWRKLTRYFAWENDLAWSKTAEQTTGKILQSINNSLNLNQ